MRHVVLAMPSAGSHDARPMSDPRKLVRATALIEAVSYLLLLGIAMPLKYAAGEPLAVHVMGMVHGLLFLLLIWFLLRAHFERGWPRQRVWLIFGASFVPFWPFFLDFRVRQWAREPR